MDYSSSDNIQNLLNKAKLLTSGQKQPSKRYKGSDVFLTDCFLQQKQKPIQQQIDIGFVDDDQLLKQLSRPKNDSLQQLRKMIKKTNKNLNDYGRNTMSLKSQTQKLHSKMLSIDNAYKSNGFSGFRTTTSGFRKK